MNKYNIKNKTRLERNTSTEGELIEQLMLSSMEAIENADGAISC